MAGKKEQPGISLADRLAFGNLTVKETRLLRNVSHSGFYDDLKHGLVAVEKNGRKSVVRGPIAKAYIEGRPIAEVIPARGDRRLPAVWPTAQDTSVAPGLPQAPVRQGAAVWSAPDPPRSIAVTEPDGAATTASNPHRRLAKKPQRAGAS
jgi:hypothetical protein